MPPMRERAARTPIWGTVAVVAILNGVLLLAFLQVSVLRTPTRLVVPAAVAPGVNAIAYDVDRRSVARGERIRLTLYLDGDPDRVPDLQVAFVRPADAPPADPVRVTGPAQVVTRPGRRLRVDLRPDIPGGTWKMRVGSNRPFGLLRVEE
jgi:hypothetical protein